MRFQILVGLALMLGLWPLAVQAQTPNPLAKRPNFSTQTPAAPVALPAPVAPAAAGKSAASRGEEEWRGAMICWKEQRSIDMHLSVTRTAETGIWSGIVTLRDTAFGTGLYEVRGKYGVTVSLQPVRWIEQIPNYYAMTLFGNLDPSGQKISGRTPARDCPTFELTRTPETALGIDPAPDARAIEARAGAERGDPEQMRRYGLFQYYGIGAKQDRPAAAALFEKAAYKGDYESTFLYGLMTESGEAGPVDLEKAYKFLYAAGKLEISLECCIRGGSKRLVGDFGMLNNPAQNAANRVWQKRQAPPSRSQTPEGPKLNEPRQPRCSTTTRCETLGVGQQICRDVAICE